MDIPKLETELSHVQARRKRLVDRNLAQLAKDFSESEQFLGEISEDQQDEITEKLSAFFVVFSDSVSHFEGVCESFATAFETPTEDVEYLVDYYYDQSLEFQRRARALKAALTVLKERKTAPPPIAKSSTSIEEKLSKAMEALLSSQKDAQQQTTHLIKSVAASNAPSGKSNINLPKLSLPSFDGNVLKYAEFMDQFTSTIHQSQLSNVEKFSYLRSCLEGEALEAISGYLLTDRNYPVVLKVIKERFGNAERAVNAHYSSLMNLTTPSNRTSSLRSFTDQIEEHLRSLEACGQDVSQNVFIAMILSKLPQHTALQLELKKKGNEWTVKELREALSAYVRAKEAVEAQSQKAESRQQGDKEGKPKQPARRAAEALVASTKPSSNTAPRQPKCHFCSGQHFSDECTRFTTVDARKAQLNDRCFRCLRKGHSARACTVTRLCYHCKRNHHRSLCPEKFPSQASTLNAESAPFTPQEALLAVGEHVYMQTAVTTVTSGSKSCKARLLFDTGATHSYVTAKLRDTLQLPTMGTEKLATASFGNAERKQESLDTTTVTVSLANGEKLVINAHVVPIITSPIRKLPVNTTAHPEVKGFQMAEPLCDAEEKVEIDILVGGDYYYDIVLPERVTFSDGLILLKSQLGYICAGKVDTASLTSDSQTLVLSTQPSDASADLKQFWAVEDAATKDTQASEDSLAMQSFNDTVSSDNNRYVVKWPWRIDPPELDSNYGLAFGRLTSLCNRLRKEPEKLLRYDQILKEQETLGIIEAVHQPSQGLTHYLPHHCVLKDDSSTTKLRLVYDASAKSSATSASLNDCLYRGPVLLPDLAGTLLRFRLNPIAISSDVEKAFLQISLSEEDRDVTRFLWVKDIDSPPTSDNLITYRFCRVPFGVVSSPFLLGATLQHHLLQSGIPEAQAILRNTYVDNVLFGVDSVAAGVEYYTRAKSVFSEASMNLRQWSSNSPQLIEQIPDADRAKGTEQKVLGLNWNTISDELNVINTSASDVLVRTKRELLAAIAQFFDPLGIHAPVVVKAKLLLQEVWRLNVGWDESLPEEILTSWRELASELDQASKVTVSRPCAIPEAEEYSLHVFCDASQSAYAAVAYLCSRTGQTTESHLILSRSKLAPLNSSPKLTIPKMELLAATLGAKLIKFCKEQLPVKLETVCLWSDSTCVLGWLSSEKNLPAFIQRRVTQIKQSVTQYQYVSSRDNPADLPSRGTTSHLSPESMWWHGPEWLQDPAKPAPVQPEASRTGELRSSSKKKEELSAEKKRGVADSQPQKKKGGDLPSLPGMATSMVSGGEDPTEKIQVFGLKTNKFSSLEKLVRVTAWAHRFIRNCRKSNPVSTAHLTVEELHTAQKMWIKSCQKSHFPEVLDAIKQKKKNNMVQSLKLYMDSDGILRSQGRLEHSTIPVAARFPILLPSRSDFTSLVISSHHRRLMHAGVSHTLASIRERYWIPRGRSSVKSVLRHCITCKRVEGGPFAMPTMAPLPPERVSQAEAFQFTGVDYFGPLFVKGKDSPTKVWTVLFTCLCTRAVHLELVLDMTADQFLLAFRRFIARRGVPQRMWSDNAPQFKTSATTLSKAWKSIIEDPEVADSITARGTEWNFIVQHAPWMGGVYERMVGLVKRALRKTVGSATLTADQLRTFLAEAEATVNSRPLIYVGGDLVCGNVITPSHFLSLKPNLLFPEMDFSEHCDPDFVPCLSSASSLLQGWKRGQALVKDFWKTWRREYLLSLRERSSSSKTNRNVVHDSPHVGQPVLIGENLPRGAWKLGVVEKVHQGQDKVIRAASVRTVSGKVLKRPVSLLYPLECDNAAVNQTNDVEPDTAEGNQPVTANKTRTRPTRQAASQSRGITQALQEFDLV